jgi:hypothetical protein
MIEILIAIITFSLGYILCAFETYLKNRNEQRLIDRIEKLGWSVLIGWNNSVNLWVVHATQPDNIQPYTHGVSRIVALSKMLNELENM